MKLFGKNTGKFKDFLYDSSINLKDRAFVVFSALIILALYVAVPCGIYMREPVSATVSTLAGAIFFSIFVYVAYRNNKIGQARIVISVMVVFAFLPAMFFTNGGVNGGAPVWILLGSYYLVMILDGKFRIFISILNIIIQLGCFIVAFNHPHLVTEYARWGNYFDNFVAYITVGLVLTGITIFQTRLYQRESQLASGKAKELEEMNRAQNRFFSSMSHEIRTPINTVLGMNELILRQEDASEEIRKDARNIQGAGKLLLALINDILDVSKIEAGKMDIVPVNYNISSLLSEIVNMIWLKAEEKGLKFNVDIDPDVPETLFGDEVRIKQILINLLNNAVKYTSEGSIGLHMECEFPESGEALLKINVSDTGMGIKPEALPHLFDTFQRVDEEKNRHIEGTGLGLSIVKQLVELMNGEITVNSVYSQGSTFAVTLRQGISSDKRIGDMSITSAGTLSGAQKFEHSFHAPGARILIVDDNEMNLQVEKKLLDGMDMTIDVALSGQDALSLTLQNRYDVVFMDHLMPVMDGIECFEKIRTQKGGMNTNVPIIVLTANAGGENIELYNNTGFDGYLVKPVSGAQLEEMLLTHLPAEKVIGTRREEMTGASMSTASRYAKKKPLIIATSTMSDLPQHILRDLNISIIPYKVITDEGIFYDTVDIDSEELVRYMKDESKLVLSEPPTEEELTAFFSSELTKAHHLIYITLTTGSSREYGWAINAAKSFDNVTVINSECLSSGTGILVMIAGRLAQQNIPVEKITAELEEAKELIKTSFVIKSTDVMARRERISPFMNSLLNALWLRPILRTKNDNLGVGKFLIGSEETCYEKYIKYAIPSNVYPDKSFAFITYAGMEEDQLLWIEEKLNEKFKFDHIVFQKASAGIASNCGEGTFGILYMIKGNHNYNLGSLFANRSEEGEIIDEITDEKLIEEEEEKQEQEQKKELQWYEKIPGIDPIVAMKNSGSEESFNSVIRIFYESYEAKSEEIQGYYDSQDWENYTIKVHALKSSSRLVGAISLGNDAEALEMAGKNNDIEYINGHHDSLIEKYHTIWEALKPIFGKQEDLPDIPADMLADAYAGLSEFVQVKDFQLAKMVMDSIKEYRLPEEDEDRFGKIGACLSQMDWDGISDILKEKL